nr:uncharacterized protein B0303.4-like [Cherax quadricarinatus]XP_053626738.1 uncharacterized protein B0303.4-like [Cherax quadricarinatus]
MISYEGIQDAVTAIVVIFVVSLVIAAAWLSTNVREQPLVATAVVVFQSGHSVEGERTLSDSGQSQRETQGSGEIEGEASALRSTSQMKASRETNVTEGSEMEMPQRTGRELAGGIQSSEACDISLPQPEVSKNSVLGSDKNDPSTLVSRSDEVDERQHLTQEPSINENVTNLSRISSIPSHVSSLEKLRDSMPEMEVRKRRLQQFMSMGETSTCSETHADASISSEVPEVKDLQNSTEEKLCGSANGAAVEDACSHATKTEDNISPLPTDSQPSLKKEEEEEEEEEEKRPPGSIRIRLKFLDETQKFVFAQPTEQVGTFKRQHFSIEMDANRRIRLIFNGQLLSQDTSTLAQYGLFDNCVVHCHVSQPQQASRGSGQSGERAAQVEEDAYVSGLLVNNFTPVLFLIL